VQKTIPLFFTRQQKHISIKRGSKNIYPLPTLSSYSIIYKKLHPAKKWNFNFNIKSHITKTSNHFKQNKNRNSANFKLKELNPTRFLTIFLQPNFSHRQKIKPNLFRRQIRSSKSTLGKIKFETLRWIHFKISSEHHQINLNGFNNA